MNHDPHATALVAWLIAFGLGRNANKTTKCWRSSEEIATVIKTVEQIVNCNSFVIEKRCSVVLTKQIFEHQTNTPHLGFQDDDFSPAAPVGRNVTYVAVAAAMNARVAAQAASNLLNRVQSVLDLLPLRTTALCRSAESASRAAKDLRDAGSLDKLVEKCKVLVCLCPPPAAPPIAQYVFTSGFEGTYFDAHPARCFEGLNHKV
jgi:hypothetical protein